MGSTSSLHEKVRYKGEFACSVSKFNKKTNEFQIIENAQDFFLDQNNNSFDIISELMEQHLLGVISKIVSPSKILVSPFRIRCGFGGDDGDGSGNFYLPFKLETIPNMYFEVTDIEFYNLTNEQHTTVLYKVNSNEKTTRFVMKFNVDIDVDLDLKNE